MAEPKNISDAEVYAQTEIILDELGDKLAVCISREVFVEIVAQSALARLKRNALPPCQVDSQIRFLMRHLIDEAPKSPLDAKQVLLMVALDDAIEQQFTRAFDDQLSDRQHEFSLNFGSKAMANRARIAEIRARSSARYQSEQRSSQDHSIAKAIEEGNRRLEKREAERVKTEEAELRANLGRLPPEGANSATRKVSP